MSNKLKKIVILAMVLSMAFGVTAFAAEPAEVKPAALMTQSYEGSYSDSFSHIYYDGEGIRHEISGTATASATIVWEEGIAGWIVDPSFPMPSATIYLYASNGEYIGATTATVTGYDPEHNSGNVAYREFKVQGYTLRCAITCDAYGDSSFSAFFR